MQNKSLSAAAIIFVCGYLFATPTMAYEPDSSERKRVADVVKPELIAATPASQRFGMRFGLAGNIPFKDYERLARRNGYEPYEDCTLATFVQVTSYQTATGTELQPEIVGGLHASCQASDATVLGLKPLSQSAGDREILRGMWQRYLEQTGKQQNDPQLIAAASEDATERFTELYGDPANYEPRQSGFVQLAADSVEEPPSADVESNEPASSPPVVVAETPAAPATGRQNDVDRLVLRTVTRYGLGGVYVTNATYLLFKDGSIFSKPFGNPYTLDIAGSKRKQPKAWGQWREQGGTLKVTWPNKKTAEWKTWFRCRAAAPGLRLAGKFQSADSFGGAVVANFNTIAFNREGQFSLTTLKGGNTAWLPVYSSSNRAGRYEFDGYTVRLEMNDGSREEFAFCLYPKDDEHFAIGSSHYVPLD